MKREISFRINKWHTEEISDEEIIYHLYGLTINNESVYCKVLGFQPHCFLELPMGTKWTKTKAAVLFEFIRSKLKECPPDTYKYETRKLDMYSLKRKFLKIDFYTKNTYRHLKNYCKYPWNIPDLGRFEGNSFRLHEHNVADEIKLGIVNDLDMSGWVDVKPLKLDNEKFPKGYSYCDYSIYANVKHVKKSVNYTPDDQVDPRILVYDIELHSINRKSKSPTPEEKNNVITMISCGIGRLSQPFDEWEVHSISLFDCKAKQGVVHDCQGSEKRLIKKFAKVVRQSKPDIITGYNINGFDWGAILTRAKILGMLDSTDKFTVLPDSLQMGKLKDGGDFIKDIFWSSGAYGKQEKKYVNIMGVLNFDLFNEITRNYKLKIYSLGFVSSNFLGGETKDDMPYQQMFILYDMISPFIRSYYDGIDLKLKVAKKMILSAVSRDELMRFPKRVNHPADMADEIYRAKTYKKLVKICVKYWKKMVDYCVQDTILVPKLMAKLNSLVSLWENSNICRVPPSYIYDRGQQIKTTAQIVYETYHDNFVFSFIPRKDDDGDDTKKNYEGGAVMKCNPGIYERVAILDFASLYPSIMRTFNMCYSTLRLDGDSRVKDEECHVAEWDTHKGCEHDPTKEKRKKILCGTNRHRFVKPVEGKPETSGILPRILKNLLEQRAAVKKKLKVAVARYKELLIKDCLTKEETEEKERLRIKIAILDSRQLAIKVNANSVYGYTGAMKGTHPCKPIAASVTYYSRLYISKSEELIKEKFPNAEVVYGDTDSVFVIFHGSTLEESFKLAKEAADYLTEKFPGYLVMEDENVYHPCLLLTKKKYEYYVVDSKGNVVKEDSKGSMNTRRDNCDSIRDIYTKAKNSVMALKSFDDTVYEVNEGILNLFRGIYPLQDYVIYQGLNKEIEEYLDSHALATFAKRLRERGNDIKANTRLEFVMIVNDNKNAKSGDRMEDWHTFLTMKDIQRMKIDYVWYVEHKLMNPLTDMLNIAYPNSEKNYFRPEDAFKLAIQCWMKPKWASLLKGLPLRQKAEYVIKHSRHKRLVESARIYYSKWVLDIFHKRHGLPIRRRKLPGRGKKIVYQNDRIVRDIAKYHRYWRDVVKEIPMNRVKLKRV